MLKWRLALMLSLAICAWSQEPVTRQPSEQRNHHTSDNQQNSDRPPIVINVQPSEKTHYRSADSQNKDSEGTNWVSVCLLAVSFLQLVVYGIQAYMLRATIQKMDSIATGQTRDIQASIAEATRASSAMEKISISMAISAASVQETVDINRDIADRQKLITEFQSRAYLMTTFGGMANLQNTKVDPPIKLQPSIKIVNRGTTPARNIRFRAYADVVDFPLRADFRFPINLEAPVGHASAIGPGMDKTLSPWVPNIYAPEEEKSIWFGKSRRLICWGVIDYEDIFGIPRFTKFGYTFYSTNPTQGWNSEDTADHNEWG